MWFRVVLVACAAVAGGDAQAPSEALKADYTRAWVLAGQQRYEEAIPLLHQIIAADKTYYPAYRTLGEAYRGRKDFASAERYFGSLATQDPGNGLAWYGLGQAYSLANHAAARENFARCIRAASEAFACYWPLVDAAVAMGAARGRRGWIGLEGLDEIKLLIPFDLGRPETYLGAFEVYHHSRRMGPQRNEAARRGLALALPLHRPGLEAFLREAVCEYEEHSEAVAHCLEAFRLFEELGDWDNQFHTAGWSVVGQYVGMGDFDRAFAWAKHAYDLACKLRNPTYQMHTAGALAGAYLRSGNPEKSEEYYGERVRLARALGDALLGQALLDLGKVQRLQGKYENALESYSGACRAAPGDVIEGFALRGIGVLEGQRGDYFKWLEHERESVRVFESIGAWWQAGAGLGNIGNIYAALGDYTSALEYYRRSLESARKFNDVSERQGNLDNIGAAHLGMGRPADALPYLTQAAGLATGTPPYEAGVRLDLAQAYTALGRHAAAIESAKSGLAIARRGSEKPIEAAALAQLGNCYLAIGNLEDARHSFTSALELAEPRGFAAAVIAARRGLGETWRRQGDYLRSFEQFRAAIEAIESMRSRVPSPEVRAGLVRENWKVYESAVAVLATLDDRSPGKGYDRQAFQYAEGVRARSFLELLAESRARITKGLGKDELARQNALSTEISKASQALLKQPSPANKLALERAERRFEEWLMDLRKTHPAYQQLAYPEPYTAERVQAEVATDGSAVLEYALGERESRVWLIDRERVIMKRLPARGAIEREVAAYRRLFARRPKHAGDLDALWQRAHRLHSLLLGPVRQYLKRDQRLIVIPDGVLYYLPFDTLAENAPRAGSAPRYFIEDFTLVYAPSASVFANLAAGGSLGKHDARRELLAYGDPVFGKAAGARGSASTGDLVRSVYRGRGISFLPLPNTRAEVEGISALFPPDRRTTYLGRQATEASVKREALSKYRRIHFATHALLDEDMPARSGVVLSLVDTGADDGILQLHEIVNLDLDAELVVLSACETGLGKLVNGEGLVGLTRAFLYAGTPRVVVSLWKVDDLGTAALMKNFYRRMREGKPPALALREAKLAMIRSEAPAWRPPFFWAPFVLVGLF